MSEYDPKDRTLDPSAPEARKQRPEMLRFPSTPDRSSNGQRSAAIAPIVSFNRQELQQILGLYGRMVAAGEWRDYAMDFLPHKAVFSIYRRTSEMPLFRVEKDPALSRKQGAYAVIAATGLIMKRGPDLTRVLAVLEKPLRLVR